MQSGRFVTFMMKKKTNFDHYLEEQLKNPEFAERFSKAGEAWDVCFASASRLTTRDFQFLGFTLCTMPARRKGALPACLQVRSRANCAGGCAVLFLLPRGRRPALQPQGPEGRSSSLLGFVAMRYALYFLCCLKAGGQSSNLKAWGPVLKRFSPRSFGVVGSGQHRRCQCRQLHLLKI